MTHGEFEQALARDGFSREEGETGVRFARVQDGVRRYCALDNVKGAAWRVFLAVGAVPPAWPTVAADGIVAQGWVEAESPWFQYVADLDSRTAEDSQFKDKPAALRQCSEWLRDVGFAWLANPGAKTTDAWRAEHNLLVRGLA